MKLKLEIEMGNAAFHDGYNGDEIARILHHLASSFRGINAKRGDDGSLRDYNGNTVGAWRVQR
jgi:hypothetical protein